MEAATAKKLEEHDAGISASAEAASAAQGTAEAAKATAEEALAHGACARCGGRVGLASYGRLQVQLSRQTIRPASWQAASPVVLQNQRPAT